MLSHPEVTSALSYIVKHMVDNFGSGKLKEWPTKQSAELICSAVKAIPNLYLPYADNLHNALRTA